MITDGEGLENNFIPFHTIISIFGETVTYLVTVLVEVWQGAFNAMLQVNYRCVDIDDVMLNTIGGIFGFCVAYFGIPRLQTIFKKTKNN